MSEIKNGGLDQYGAEPLEQQQFGTAGVKGVKHNDFFVNFMHTPDAFCLIAFKWWWLMMMKLAILPGVEELEPSLVYRTNNHELKPISTGPISRGSQCGVYKRSSMAEKIHRKGKFWV